MINNSEQIYRLHPPKDQSDYEAIATNGHAYTRKVAGFSQLLKRGIADPPEENAILVELYSPNVPDILWAGATWAGIAILVTSKVASLLAEWEVTGYEFWPTYIVKVATLGKQKRKSDFVGEPENLIEKRKNMIDRVENLPTLIGLHVSGRREVVIDTLVSQSGNKILPYTFQALTKSPDIFHASLKNNEQYGGHIFCTEQLKDKMMKEGLKNIEFTPFEIWMSDFQAKYYK